MKRHGNLYQKIISPDNLYLAYRRARAGKARMRGVLIFERNVEDNLTAIHKLLVDKAFHTSAYTQKKVYEPKERIIYVLPFFPDRIVQHALMNILIPIWTPLFIPDSYACIEGRGIHAGSRRTMEFVRRNAYCLKCDISKFYPSMNHNILLDIVKQKIKCADTLWLIEDIIRSFPGDCNVPIGNLTSQWFGNVYLNMLDQYVKHKLKVKDYLRYCDDFLFFHDDKEYLKDIAQKVKLFLAERLQLRMSKCDLFPVSRGVDFLGYRHFKGYVLLRKRSAKRMQRRLKKLPAHVASGRLTPEEARGKLASAWGWLKWANCYHLKMAVHLRELMEWIDDECARRKESAPALQ